ncbi:MAG: ROK family protein [Bacteroidetes bacterium]|nr:ROK family protein [Bacteroidota bacterium]
MKFRHVLGIDVGGSGIKGALVDTKKGIMTTERHRIETPQPATPEAVVKTIYEISRHFNWKGPIGIGFPAVVQNGLVKTASNIDNSWIGVDIDALVKNMTGLPAFAVNDADAAGMAEMSFGAGMDMKGTIMLVTIGTGLGTVMFTRGKLLANTELGHVLLKNGMEAELYASDAARKNEDLSWEDWARRFNEYLLYIENLFWPELFIIGGGASKKEGKFFDYLTVDTPVVAAMLQNDAGIIGAAMSAKYYKKQKK